MSKAKRSVSLAEREWEQLGELLEALANRLRAEGAEFAAKYAPGCPADKWELVVGDWTRQVNNVLALRNKLLP